MISRDLVIWAAGLFEGEGCIGVRTCSGNPYARLQLNTTDKDVLERFHDGVGGLGKIYGPLLRPGCKPVYKWHAHGFERSQAIIAMFWPWLGQRRRAKYRELVARQAR